MSEHRRTACLPYGFTATFKFGPATVLAVDWQPDVLSIRSARAWRRFYASYEAERNGFLTEIATMLGGSVLIADVACGGIVGTPAIRSQAPR